MNFAGTTIYVRNSFNWAETTGKNPTEQTAISRVLESLPLDFSLSPGAILSGAYESIAQNSDISAETKNSIREAWGVPKSHQLETGTDVFEALEKGKPQYERDKNGEILRDKDGKPIISKTPQKYTKENPLELRDGVTVFESTKDKYQMSYQIPDGRTLDMEFSRNMVSEGNKLREMANSLIVMGTFEKMGINDLFGLGMYSEIGEIKMTSSLLARTNNIVRSMVNFSLGGKILSQGQVNQMTYNCRWLIPGGELLHAGARYNREKTREEMISLGVLPKGNISGVNINFIRFQEIMDMVRPYYGKGTPSLENLKNMLISRGMHYEIK